MLADCNDPAPRGWLRQLTFDRTQIAGPLQDFPLLVRVIDSHLGVFAAADGRDLHFVAPDGGALLDYEIELFDANRGELTAWVRVSELETGSDPQLYLAYGDGHAHDPVPDRVWADHHFVWHLTDELGTSEARVRDATGRAPAAASGETSAASSVPGVAGRGLEFDGRDDQLLFDNDVLGSTPSTLQAWVIQRRLPVGSLGSAILMLGDGADDRARFLLSLEQASSSIRYGFFGNDLGDTALTFDVWHQLVWTWDGRRSSLFIDGQLVEGPRTHGSANTTGRSGRIGGFDSNYQFFMAGTLDEIRVSTVARSREWIATEYANQRPGSTFLKTIGDPEPAR